MRFTLLALTLLLVAGCAGQASDNTAPEVTADSASAAADEVANRGAGAEATVDEVANRGAGAETAVESDLGDSGFIDVEDLLPNDLPTPVPTPTALAESDVVVDNAAGAELQPYEAQLVVSRESMDLVAMASLDLPTPEIAVQEFFAALQAGDYPLVFVLLDWPGRTNMATAPYLEESSLRSPIGNDPGAREAMRSRIAALGQVSGYQRGTFARFEVVMEEAARHGAFPLDISQGIYGLEPFEPAEAEDGRQEFTARLRATDEPVHIVAARQPDSTWRMRRVGLLDADPSVAPFAGPPEGSSTPLDPAAGWSTYDRLSTATPEDALAQIATLATDQRWVHVYLLLDSTARAHADVAAGDNPGLLFDAGDDPSDLYALEQEHYGGPLGFAEVLSFGVAHHDLGVPLTGYEIGGRVDTTDAAGNQIAVLEATHPDEGGEWAITFVDEGRGWRLRQIRRPGAPEQRLPFSFESTLQVYNWGDHRVVEIDDLRPFVQATAAFLNDDDFALLWAGFVQSAHSPQHAWFANAFVESAQLVWVDWKASDQVAWSANGLAEAMGLDPTFEWDYEVAIAAYEADWENELWPVVAGLVAFDQWLDERGYHLVQIDPGWDAYLAVAVPDQDAFVALADVLGINTHTFDDY